MRMMLPLLVALVLLGCSGSAPEDMGNAANASLETGISGAAGANNSTNQAEPCLRVFTYCYTGETIMSQDCIDGKPVKWVCEPYYARHNRSIAGIPPHYLYIAEYMCYWENRDKFGFAANYHPAAVCEGPIVLGWKESCDCAWFIDLNERSNPQRYYIKR